MVTNGYKFDCICLKLEEVETFHLTIVKPCDNFLVEIWFFLIIKLHLTIVRPCDNFLVEIWFFLIIKLILSRYLNYMGTLK
jgi:hypothetical protein